MTIPIRKLDRIHTDEPLQRLMSSVNGAAVVAIAGTGSDYSHQARTLWQRLRHRATAGKAEK